MTHWLRATLALALSLILGLTSWVWPAPSQAQPAAAVLDGVDYATLRPHVAALTAIETHSGWRTAGSSGERQAFDYIEGLLDDLPALEEQGLTLTRQTFPIYATTEIHETGLSITHDGQTLDIPAEALLGPRDDAQGLLHYDTDGTLNDTDPDPVTVQGTTHFAGSRADLSVLVAEDALADAVLLLDYSLIDLYVARPVEIQAILETLIAHPPAAIVLVTQFSATQGQSHGTEASFSPLLANLAGQLPPLMLARLEDFAAADLDDLASLNDIQAAELLLDVDVVSPAESQNLIAHIPGADSSRALLLGVKVDSLNNPGGLDNASGVAALLEVARVLDAEALQPPVDVYLLFFGAETAGLYGSSHFVATHQDLLDQSYAMLSLDSLSAPLDGIDAGLDLIIWSYTRLGQHNLPWPNLLRSLADDQSIALGMRDLPTVVAGNGAFNAFDVPNANLRYQNLLQMTNAGGFVYAGRLQTPYGDVALVDDYATVLEDMTRVALLAVLEAPAQAETVRVTPQRNKQALLIGSHTEATPMVTSALSEFGMALSLQGFDVDLVPFGETVSAAALDAADVVVVFPAHDFGETAADGSDVGWTEDEAALIEEYVAGGGFLIITNSARHIAFDNRAGAPNEDVFSMNTVAQPFGVTFIDGQSDITEYKLLANSVLFEGVEFLDLGNQSVVRFTIGANGVALAGTSAQDPLVAGLEYGENGGLVLVIGDLGILHSRYFLPGTGVYRNPNLGFWMNLANMMTLHANDEI